MMPKWADRSFRERSAWIMGGVLGGLGLWYFTTLGPRAWQAGHSAPLGLLARYTIWAIFGSMVVQTLLAVINPHDAHRPADERERRAAADAAAQSGDVLAFGVILAAIWFLGHGDGLLLFHGILASLVLAQIIEQFGTAWRLSRGD